MSWKLLEILRRRRAAETGSIPQGRGGALSVCLIYPNRYNTAMSSLGFQAVYRLFNDQPDVVCERAFLPDREELAEYEKDGTTLLSLESERPVSDFDLIAFSISFEPDYINIPKILRLARIPVLSSERSDRDPLILAGGAACFINPEPAAGLFDLIAIGEGEPLIPSLTDFLVQHQSMSRDELLKGANGLPGVYVPSLDSGPVQRVCDLAHAQSPPAASVILTDETEFGNMFLVEVSRGCPRGCRFCAAGFVYQPFRQHSLELLEAACLEGLKHRKTIGLVGAAVSDHPDILKLCRFIVEHGGSPSLSSLRVDRINPELLELLAKAGHRTISLAPEGGSQRMRDMLRKNLTRAQILDATTMVAKAGILNLRLYLIIGLPGETEADLVELLEMVAEIKERVLEEARGHGRIGEITMSVNPFIPKPFTPLQWAGMCPMPELKQKVELLERAVKKIPNVRLKVEGLQDCYLQALLSKGSRALTPLILKLGEGLSLKRAAKETGIDTDRIVNANLPVDADLPWEILDVTDRNRLLAEYELACKLPSEK
jgi:radical SAM superfamily enzyme YgiQ (UPF0313 family)